MHPATLDHALPDDARLRLAAMTPAGVQAVAFTLAGGWVIAGRAADGHPGYAARAIPDACFVKLGEFVRAGHVIHSIAFPPSRRSGWVIVSDQAYFASGIAGDCFDALVAVWAQGLRPSCIAFAPAGDGWALLAGATVHCRDIADGCRQALTNLAQGLRPARQLAFAPGGGWALLSADGITAANIDGACRDHLAQLAQAHVALWLAFTPGGGWAVGSNRARTVLPVDPLREFEARFRLVNHRWHSLAERMAAQRVAGLRMALRIAGRPTWATAHGEPASVDATVHAIDRNGVSPQLGFTANAHGEGGAASAEALADEIADALLRVYATSPAPIIP